MKTLMPEREFAVWCRELGISLTGPFTCGDDEPYYEIAVPSPNGLEWRVKAFESSLPQARSEAVEIAVKALSAAPERGKDGK